MLVLIHTVVNSEHRVADIDSAIARAMYDAKLLSLIDGVALSDEFIEFATEWHNGLDSMLYAVASSGTLKRGNVRPTYEDDGGNTRHMTDLMWYRHLWIELGREVRKLQQQLHNADDYATAEEFLQYINNVVDNVLPPVYE